MNRYTVAATAINLLPQLLKQFRTEQGLSQREAAKRIGCAHGTLCKIERGDDCNSHIAYLILSWMGREEDS